MIDIERTKLRRKLLIGAFIVAVSVSALERTWSLLQPGGSPSNSRSNIIVEDSGSQYVPQFTLYTLDGDRVTGDLVLTQDVNVLCFGSFT